jgi:nucleotide-binding universal stress UspA family protein
MKLLVGYDSSSMANDVLKLAQKHAEFCNAEIYVVKHMHQTPALQYEEIQKAEIKLKKEVSELFIGKENSYRTYVLVNPLDAGESLVEFAENKKVDEIFIGVRRRSKVGKLFFGSTAQYIILHAPCPVVTMR